MKENEIMNLRVQGRETWKGFDDGKETWGNYILILKNKIPKALYPTFKFISNFKYYIKAILVSIK